MESVVPIPSAPDDTPRPLWSVMIPTYNCAAFLRQTLKSVLAQDPGPELMHIEVVDDHSSDDDPEAVVAEVGRGRVHFFRQPQNVGHVRNFNTCLSRSRGRLVHLLHGDDLVLQGFYQKLGRAFEEGPTIGAAFCRHLFMDEEGHWTAISELEQRHRGVIPDWIDRIAVNCRLQAPSMVVRRSVYEDLGGFDRRIKHYGEDWEMWARIAVHYPVWYETEPLAAYRSRTTSLSGVTVRSGENMADLRRAFDAILSHLSSEQAARLGNVGRLNLAGFALKKALWLLDAGEMAAAAVQIREAVASSRSARIVAATAFTSGLWIMRWLGLANQLGPGTPSYMLLRKVLAS